MKNIGGTNRCTTQIKSLQLADGLMTPVPPRVCCLPPRGYREGHALSLFQRPPLYHFDGDGCSLKLEFCNDSIGLILPSPSPRRRLTAITQGLRFPFNPSEADEKDLKYIVEDFADTQRFSKGKSQRPKLPLPFQTAVRNGAFYDAVSAAVSRRLPRASSAFQAKLRRIRRIPPEDFSKARYALYPRHYKRNNPQKMKRSSIVERYTITA